MAKEKKSKGKDVLLLLLNLKECQEGGLDRLGAHGSQPCHHHPTWYSSANPVAVLLVLPDVISKVFGQDVP
jgi:hypothetical protein